jgi:hypothetical protein
VTAAVDPPRRYRFGPLDRSGWLLGLGPVACLTLGSGLLAAGLALRASGSLVLAAAPLAVASAVAFGRHHGRALHEWIPPVAGWLSLQARGHDRWSAQVVPIGGPVRAPDLPPFLAGLEFLEVPARFDGGPRATGVAVVVDGERFSATVRVRGGPFALLEPAEQARVLDAWGRALAGFCRERTPVTRVAWSEWAAPASLAEHLAFVRDQQDGRVPTSSLGEYLELVGRAGPLTIAHETQVTVTVDRRRVRGTRATDPQRTVEVLLDELRLLAGRLEQAGLAVDSPLSPGELASVMRLRADPSAASRLGARRERLAEQARLVSPHNLAPISVETAWRHVRVDQAWHRSFWIAEWPRLEVHADWLASLLLHPGGIRTVTVVHEPVAPSRSRRAIDREATRLASDEDERSRRGFRIRAQHRRAESEVLARESEIVSGYSELRYSGFVTVTTFDPRALADQCDEWEQVCAQCGLELRALDGQHDLALAAALPVGRVSLGRGQG